MKLERREIERVYMECRRMHMIVDGDRNCQEGCTPLLSGARYLPADQGDEFVEKLVAIQCESSHGSVGEVYGIVRAVRVQLKVSL